MRCYYVQLVNLHSGALRGWVVPARSRWAAKRAAKSSNRQLRHYWPDLTLWGGGR